MGLACSLGGGKVSDQNTTAYDFSFVSLIGSQPLPLSQFRGKVLLVVNTASKCGFTSQYEGLEKLYQTYKDQGLVVLGVPSNDFADQEPGSSEEIAHFCKRNFGVSFPLTSKQKLSGEGAHPFYVWAKNTLGFGTSPVWNFHKYLISRDGHLVTYFYSTTSPESSRVKLAIEEELAKPTS